MFIRTNTQSTHMGRMSILLGVLTLAFSFSIACETGDNPSSQTQTVSNSDLRLAIFVSSPEVTDNEYVGVEIALDTDSTFASVDQTWQTATAARIQDSGADFVIESAFTATVTPGSYYVRVRVYTDAVQANVFAGALAAESNLNTPPQVTIASNAISTLTVPLDWNPGSLGSGELAVEGENAVVFWVGGALSKSSNARILDSTEDPALTAITVTVLDSTGTTTYRTITGNIATGTFYSKIIAPQGTTLVDLQVAVTGSAETFATWNAGGGDDITVADGVTYTFDILTD